MENPVFKCERLLSITIDAHDAYVDSLFFWFVFVRQSRNYLTTKYLATKFTLCPQILSVISRIIFCVRKPLIFSAVLSSHIKSGIFFHQFHLFIDGTFLRGSR